MAYVIIQGRSLAGYAGGVRGQRDGLGPHFWPDGKGGFSGAEGLGINRGRRAGLGAVSTASTASAQTQFEMTTQQLVSGVAARGQQLADATGFVFRSNVQGQVNAIVQRLQQDLANISRQDSTGAPLYVTKPDVGVRLLKVAQQNANEMLDDLRQAMIENHIASFGGSLGPDAIKSFIQSLIDTLIRILTVLAEALGKGLGAAAQASPIAFIVGGAALLLYLKFR